MIRRAWQRLRLALRRLRLLSRLRALEQALAGATICCWCGTYLNLTAAKVEEYTTLEGKTVHVCRFCRADFEQRHSIKKSR